MKRLFAISLFVLLVAVAACSSTGDPESEFLSEASLVPAEQPPGIDLPEVEQSAAPQQPAPSPAATPVVPTLPAEIPDLPVLWWPTMDDPSPTAEDALKDYLLHHPSEDFGYKLVVGCLGLTAEANPNTLCAREPSVSPENDLEVYTYDVGRPPPEIADYSIGIQGSSAQGWWILWASKIAR